MPVDSQGNYYADPNDSAGGGGAGGGGGGGGGGGVSLPTVDIQTIADAALATIEGTDATGVSKSQRQFEIGLSAAAATTQHVYYYVAPHAGPTGTASVSKDDFAAGVSFLGDASYSKVEFLPGITRQIITIDIVKDSVYEPDEGYIVQLLNPSSGIELDANNAAYSWWIENDDITARISSHFNAMDEGNIGITRYPFTVTLNKVSDVDQIVNWNVVGTGEHPTDKNDFVATAGTVMIKKGDLSVDLNLSVKGDTNKELDETFDVVLSSNRASPMAFSDAGKIAHGTIASDELPTFFDVWIDKSGIEGDILNVSFRLQQAQSRDQSITWRVNGYSGNGYNSVSAEDFANNRWPNETVIIKAGKLSATTTISLKKDNLTEAAEAFDYEILSTSENIAFSGLYYNISNAWYLDNSISTIEPLRDQSVSVTSIYATSLKEGAANSSISNEVIIYLSSSRHEAITFDYFIVGAAVDGVAANDFTGNKLPSGKLTVAAGATSGSAHFSIKGDSEMEFNEGYIVTLSTTDSVITEASRSTIATGLILNDDGIMGSRDDDFLLGDVSANKINGGQGWDTLNGGLGNDTLIGGGGDDGFMFSSALGPRNVDTITDFMTYNQVQMRHGGDKLLLSMAIFNRLGETVDADEFYLTDSRTPQDANDYLIYNQETGALYYDADGSGSAAKVQFAVVATSVFWPLSVLDFEMVL